MEKHFANMDGFRCYKVKNRGDQYGDRLFIAPVYIIGLPGDVELLNKEMDAAIMLKLDNVMNAPPLNIGKDKTELMKKGECLEESIGDSCCKEKI